MTFRSIRTAGCAALFGASVPSALAQPPAGPLASPRMAPPVAVDPVPPTPKLYQPHPGRKAPAPTAVKPNPPASPYQPTKAAYPIDLPTALRLADADNPTANVARARVGQALAELDRARVAWVPNLTFGPSFFHHDGIDQNRRGDVFSVDRGNFAVVGGPTARFDLGDAFYLPLVGRRLAEAAGSRSRAVTNSVQLDVAVAYLDLVEQHGLLAINADILDKAEQVLTAAEAGARAGVNKTAADVNRAATEVNLRREERAVLRGRAAAAGARLSGLLLLDPAVELTPFELAVVPVFMVPGGLTLDQLVETGLRARPEVAAAGAELQAAQALTRQARITPLLPRVEAQFLGGGFSGWRQGGRPEDVTAMRGQYNAGAALVWQLDNLGFGNAAEIRARDAGYAAALYRVREVQARVSVEVAEAARTSAARFDALAPAQDAVRQAQEMYRKFRETSFGMVGPRGQFDALEPLTAVQALNQTRVEYLRQVVEFNRSQFRLYAAIGQPALAGLDAAVPQVTDVPVVPGVDIQPRNSAPAARP
jgi:outer membrane protein TolC